MRSGKLACAVLSAAITQGVLITTTEERAEKLCNFADEICRGTGLKPPEVCVYYSPNDMPKVTYTFLDEFWKEE